jgi:hypothetical protein
MEPSSSSSGLTGDPRPRGHPTWTTPKRNGTHRARLVVAAAGSGDHALLADGLLSGRRSSGGAVHYLVAAELLDGQESAVEVGHVALHQ